MIIFHILSITNNNHRITSANTETIQSKIVTIADIQKQNEL